MQKVAYTKMIAAYSQQHFDPLMATLFYVFHSRYNVLILWHVCH